MALIRKTLVFCQNASTFVFFKNLLSYQKNLQMKTRIAFSFLHAFFMVIVTLISLSLSITFGDDLALIQLTSAFKNMIFKHEAKAVRSRFLFVSVTWEKELIEKTDTVGFPIGNDVITNRQSLGKLLQIINQKPENHEFLILDVFFKDSSPSDSLLKAELLRVKKCLVSYHKTENDKPDKPIFDAPIGLSDMQTYEDMVLKYQLIQGDSLKTTPLLMYEQLYKTKLEEGFFYDKLNGNSVLNSFIMDFEIRKYDIFQAPDSLRYPMVYISELLTLPPDVVHKYMKDRIVVIGDFEGADKHKTIYGEMPGPVILLDAFLALERGDNILSPFFLLLIFFGFALASYKCFTIDDFITVWVDKKFGKYPFIVSMTADVASYLVFFALLSIASYFIFHIHLTILSLAVYMQILESVLQSYDEHRKEVWEKIKAFFRRK